MKPRTVPTSARLAADALLVVMAATILILVATYYPKAPSRPRWPASEQRESAPLPSSR
jgi:hypothetical protein